MDYKRRTLETKIDELFEVFSVVALTGPRQAGKSTLIKHYIGNDWKYYSLDNRELLLRIKSDPTLFVTLFGLESFLPSPFTIPFLSNFRTFTITVLFFQQGDKKGERQK